MKKSILFGLSLLILPFLNGCQNNNAITDLTFSQSEYTIKNNDIVKVDQENDNILYSFAGDVPVGVSLNNKTGQISFDDTVKNYSQVLYYAYLDNSDVKSDYVVLTLSQDIQEATLTFTNPIDYISDGDYILASNSNNQAIKYELDGEPIGISIDSISGRVSFTDKVSNGEQFDVIISSYGVSLKKTFIAATTQLAKVENTIQSAEIDSKSPVAYILDFSDITSFEYQKEFIGIMYGKTSIDSSNYSYNETNNQITLSPEFLKTFTPGENELIIVTSRNTIIVKLLIANKFIKTPQDLASIGESRDALKGYYILLNDIDLTDYLSMNGEGYNDGKGWNPIGIYHDVTDGTALLDTFQGTFDGNGYTISGLYINRSDELAYNAGLFGYVSNMGVIKNLGVKGLPGTTNSVRSYSGGLVGFNAGTISNCWADVDLTNYSGENIFKIIGGFVGRNEGTITNCFSYGMVSGDESVGAFAGYNSGTINNCYALKENGELFIGDGLNSDTSILFETLQDLINYDYSDILDSTYWTFDNINTPTLNHYLKYYFVYDIEISNKDLTANRGDEVEILVNINPSDLYDQYINDVKYYVDGEGYSINENIINTYDAKEYEFIVTISLTIDEQTFTNSKIFKLYDNVESVSISESVPLVMEADQSYQLSCNISPLTARQDVEYRLSPSTIDGVTLDGDIITLSEDIAVDSFKLYARADNKNSSMVTISVKKFTFLKEKYTYNQDTIENNIEFKLPNNPSLDGLIVLENNEEIDFKVNNDTILVSSNNLKSNPDVSFKYTFKTSDGNLYRAYATYLDRPNYDLDYLKGQEYYTINSIEDFYKYFNVKDYDSTRYDKYYSKTFILTNDLDFSNETLYGIGYEGRSFTGKIYGQGHIIKNVNINENEQYFTLDESGQLDNYRPSKYAVGFFGAFDGQIYDVTFENINVYANNWVGTFACSILNNAILENIYFIDCSSIADGGIQDDIAPTNNGKLNAVYYDFIAR